MPDMIDKYGNVIKELNQPNIDNLRYTIGIDYSGDSGGQSGIDDINMSDGKITECGIKYNLLMGRKEDNTPCNFVFNLNKNE